MKRPVGSDDPLLVVSVGGDMGQWGAGARYHSDR
jgi:hypothetical protein